MSRPHLLVALLVGFGAILATGCQLDADLALVVTDDGSGLVRVAAGLDEDAIRRVPDLSDQIIVDDLKLAGWTIRGPALEADGWTWLRASKPFTHPEGAEAVLDEVSGPDGPFRGLRLTRESSLTRTTYRFDGDIDLTKGLATFSDEALRQLLDGQYFGGAETTELEAGLSLEVAVDLPGSGPATWEASLPELVRMEAESRPWNAATVLWLGVAALAAVILVALLVSRTIAIAAGSRRLRR